MMKEKRACENSVTSQPVLRIHFILKENIQIFVLFYLLILCYAKTWWTIQKSGNMYNLFFFNS